MILDSLDSYSLGSNRVGAGANRVFHRHLLVSEMLCWDDNYFRGLSPSCQYLFDLFNYDRCFGFILLTE